MITTALSLAAILFIDSQTAVYGAVVLILVSTACLGLMAHKSNQNTQSISSSVKSTGVNLVEVNSELNQLFDLLDAAIKEDLVVVKQELLQIKGLVNNAVNQLTESFCTLSSSSEKQLVLVNEFVEALSTTGSQEILSEIDSACKQIKDSSATAVRSLQFEDIVIQVSDNSLQYLENLEKFLNEFKGKLATRINAGSQSRDAADQLKLYVADVKQIRQEVQLPDRKAVHQNNLSEGGIELF